MLVQACSHSFGLGLWGFAPAWATKARSMPQHRIFDVQGGTLDSPPVRRCGSLIDSVTVGLPRAPAYMYLRSLHGATVALQRRTPPV